VGKGAVPRPPDGLKTSGRRLWRAVVADHDLEQHERELLRRACRTADLLAGLEALVADEGLTSVSSQGSRVHPAIVELRQQRIAFARLLAALNVLSGVEGEEDGRRSAAPRGVRRPYRLLEGGAS
jgi:uncharacterized protein with von Willebrand factor type A (vWA) domain